MRRYAGGKSEGMESGERGVLYRTSADEEKKRKRIREVDEG